MGLAGKADSRWPVLSQGERGRALVARALVGEPDLLLLDEPSTGLDMAAHEQLLATVALTSTHPELALLMVTHHLEELSASTTHAVLLRNGRVVRTGHAQDVLTTEHVTWAFAHAIRVGRHDGRWYASAELAGTMSP